jgi:hypothetical protein
MTLQLDSRRNVDDTQTRTSGHTIVFYEPHRLVEMWIEDPDGVRIVFVEVPADHPLRRDPR